MDKMTAGNRQVERMRTDRMAIRSYLMAIRLLSNKVLSRSAVSKLISLG